MFFCFVVITLYHKLSLFAMFLLIFLTFSVVSDRPFLSYKSKVKPKAAKLPYCKIFSLAILFFCARAKEPKPVRGFRFPRTRAVNINQSRLCRSWDVFAQVSCTELKIRTPPRSASQGRKATTKLFVFTFSVLFQ